MRLMKVEIPARFWGRRLAALLAVGMVAGAPVALVQSAQAADYVRLKGDDPSGQSAFLTTNWSDNRTPHGDADYIVTNNFLLRGPAYSNKNATNYVFGGRSLTLGTTSSSGRLALGAGGGGGRTTVDNLVLVKGQLRVVAANLTAPLYGNITVESPASAPFAVQSASGVRTMHIYSAISGEEGTGLLFSSDVTSSTCTSVLYGDNSNYLGSFTIGGGANNMLTFAHASGGGVTTGGDPSTYTPKGIVVKDGATVRFSGSTVRYANRGIYVESSGGVLRQAGSNSYLTMPLSGDAGAKLVKTGPDQTAFYGTWTNVTVDVREGTFSLGTGAPTPGEGASVIVSGGTLGLRGETAPNLPISMTSGFISPYGTASGSLVLSNATVTGGGVRIDYDYANDRCDMLTLDEGCTFDAATFNVDLVNLPVAGDTNRYPVLVVPDSVCRLTMDKLAVSCNEVDESYYPACLKTELETVDGVNTLYISRTNSVVYFVKNQISTGTGNWQTPSYWSDGVGLLDDGSWRTDVDFLIAGVKDNNSASEYFAARTPNSNGVEQFLGRSLTVVGSYTKTARVLIKSLALSGDDFRLGANGWICGAAAADSSLTQYVTGTVTVAESATRERPAFFATTAGRTFEVRAELKGTGVTGVSATTVNGTSKVVFTRENPEFRGKFVVKTNYTNDTEVSAGAANMLITGEGCLGPAPDEPTPDVVEVCTGGWFGSAVNDVTVDDPTRGITFQHQSGVVASSGTTLTLKAPLTLKGSFYKRGGGDAVLDSTNVVVTSVGGIMVENSGCLQVNKPDMFWGYSRFRFDKDNKAALRFPLVPANEESGTYGVAMNTTSQSPFTDLTSAAHPYLPVKIDLGDTPPASAFRVVLCSVTPAAANLLRGHIDVLTSVKGFTCSVVEDDVTYKNTALKRFTAVFSLKGMCILFR